MESKQYVKQWKSKKPFGRLFYTEVKLLRFLSPFKSSLLLHYLEKILFGSEDHTFRTPGSKGVYLTSVEGVGQACLSTQYLVSINQTKTVAKCFSVILVWFILV